jgi:hypothetical protein
MKREERFQFKVAARAGPAPPFLVQQHCYPYIYCYRRMLSLSEHAFVNDTWPFLLLAHAFLLGNFFFVTNT